MRKLRQLLTDTNGATLVEFAMISPVLMLMLLGMFDMGHNYYVQSQLQGAIQKAARDSTIEGAEKGVSNIDARVTHSVHQLIPDAEVTFHRKAYANFNDVSQPEDYDDINDNGACDDGEPFEDANGNGFWDEDRGTVGLGGARDAVLYTVNISYTRIFPIGGFVGVPDTVETEATTVLRNQPFGEQTTSDLIGNCP